MNKNGKKPKKKGKALTASMAAANPSSTLSGDTASHMRVFATSIFLAAITFAVFGQTVRFGFVNYDDQASVYDNPVVTAGLTLRGLAWAFSHYNLANWIPLATVSHMLDCQFYGLDAGGHHLTNVLLHAASAIVLFLMLRAMTGVLWPSAFVAAVFAIHPLHVESVAWVTERKDVLSGLLFMLTLLAYLHYTRRPSSLRRYLTVAILFALGLMSKPMLVTVPLILLLLDYWPLNRFTMPRGSQMEPLRRLKNTPLPARLVIEKIPLLALVTACGIVTMIAQNGAIQPMDTYPLSGRAANALVSYVIYGYQTFCPMNLAVLYPYPANGFSLLMATAAFIALTGISLVFFLCRQKRPYLWVGWLWYLLMLLPVIGLVQTGHQARADRYTYLPQIGLCLLLTWWVVDMKAWTRRSRVALAGGAVLIVGALAVVAAIQTTCWRDSESLWTHALECTRNNSIAENHLGLVLAQRGQVEQAIPYFQRAVEIDPHYADAYNNLGTVYIFGGQTAQALLSFQKAAELEPNIASIQINLGLSLVKTGQLDASISHFQKAVSLDPDNTEARRDLTAALAQRSQTGEAPAKADQ